MTQAELIDDLFINHTVLLLKNLPLYQSADNKQHAIQNILNELEHLAISGSIIKAALDRLDLALLIEAAYNEMTKKLVKKSNAWIPPDNEYDDSSPFVPQKKIEKFVGYREKHNLPPKKTI